MARNQQAVSSYRDGGRGGEKETGLLIQKLYFWNSFQIWIMPGIQALDTLPSSAVAALKKGKDKRNDKLWDRVQNEVGVTWESSLYQSVNLSVCLFPSDQDFNMIC